MILPRYSIRTVFYLAIVVSLIAIVAGQGVRGETWAIAVTMAVGSLALFWAVYVAFYVLVAGFAKISQSRSERAPRPAYYPELKHASIASPTSTRETGLDENV